MTRVIFCGQAPSRVGDGRPFTGPSGRRLCMLSGLEDYEALSKVVMLTNIFDQPASRKPLPARRRTTYNSMGDPFDRVEATRRARKMLQMWRGAKEKIIVVAMGHNVYRAFVGERGIFFRGKRLGRVEIWCFPHPSGASAYWNEPEHVERAGRFLRKLLKRSGFEGA